MKKHNCNNNHSYRDVNSRRNISADNCPCANEASSDCETPSETQPCAAENQITISGKVMYRGQGVHLATVVVTRNRQVVAECLTDCDGCYEFTGIRSAYLLRAHKNNRRSRARSISCNNSDRFEMNFNLM